MGYWAKKFEVGLDVAELIVRTAARSVVEERAGESGPGSLPTHLYQPFYIYHAMSASCLDNPCPESPGAPDVDPAISRSRSGEGLADGRTRC